nr:hypothetical protein [Tanacetum cinerariifolium]
MTPLVLQDIVEPDHELLDMLFSKEKPKVLATIDEIGMHDRTAPPPKQPYNRRNQMILNENIPKITQTHTSHFVMFTAGRLHGFMDDKHNICNISIIADVDHVRRFYVLYYYRSGAFVVHGCDPFSYCSAETTQLWFGRSEILGLDNVIEGRFMTLEFSLSGSI